MANSQSSPSPSSAPAPAAAPRALPPVLVGDRGIALQNLDDLLRLANVVVASGIGPKGDSAPAVAIKMQLGLELGLPPMSALKSIAVINNRPSIFGDSGKALLLASGLQDGAARYKWSGAPGSDEWACRVTLKRKGMEGEFVGEFSVAQAKRAKLWNKEGPWTQYPDRQIEWRAWWRAAKEGFADVLGGISAGEEELDMPEGPRDVTITVADAPTPTAKPQSLNDLDRLASGAGTLYQQDEPAPPVTKTAAPANTEAGKQEGPTTADAAGYPWDMDAAHTLEVLIPVKLGWWEAWADKLVPNSPLTKNGARTWRDVSKGTLDGYRHKMLRQAVEWAVTRPTERTEFHERCAVTLAMLEREAAAPKAPDSDPTPEFPWAQ